MSDAGNDIDLSKAQTDAEWMARLDELGEELGWFEPLGTAHAAFFCEGSADVLLVSFEALAEIRAGGGRQRPRGYEVASARGWASLSLVARGEPWFRQPPVWELIDRLTDDGFFDRFDRVVFFGTGACGHAACAYAVAAPGATVLAVAPQATLGTDRAAWDTRFPEARRLDFTTRYGYAPDMVEAAAQVFIIHDPALRLDAMHASLFRGPNVTALRTRWLGRDTARELHAMDVLGPALTQVCAGTLTRGAFYTLFRRRHRFGTYLMRLALRTEALGRPWLTLLVTRAALRVIDSPRLRAMHDAAQQAQPREPAEP